MNSLDLCLNFNLKMNSKNLSRKRFRNKSTNNYVNVSKMGTAGNIKEVGCNEFYFFNRFIKLFKLIIFIITREIDTSTRKGKN